MKEVIEEFTSVILKFTVHREGIKGVKEIERCQIIFIDATRLVVYQSVQGTKFKYSYQWMDSENRTLYRWDNTPHFPQFSTFPFHRHVGEFEIAEPFEQVDLKAVLEFITPQLSAT